MKTIFFAICACVLISSCASAKVGSKAWCENMAEKSKADWSINDAKDYGKHCVLK